MPFLTRPLQQVRRPHNGARPNVERLASPAGIRQCRTGVVRETPPLPSAKPSWIGLGAFAVWVAIGATSGGARAAEDTAPRELTIASEGARPPYNYFDGDKLEGFEIELGQDLCRRMKVRCKFVAEPWDDLIPKLLERRYDAVMAAMEINKQRSVQIAFSVPYVRLPSAFLVRKTTDIKNDTPEGLAGHRVGVEQGGPHLVFLEKEFPETKIKRYGSLADAILDLEAGRVDAALGDKDAIVSFLETRRDAACCRVLADVPRYPAYFGDGIGVGLRKGDVALKAAFDTAIAASLADGTFQRISARYFSFPIDGPVTGRMVERH